MNLDEISPLTPVYLAGALFFTAIIADDVTTARTEATGELTSECFNLLGTNILNFTFVENALKCILGVRIWIAIPGAFGLYLLFFYQLQKHA